MQRWSWLDAVRREVIHAVRALKRSPAFSATVILILALAIGMTTAIIGVFDAVVRRRLPVRDQDRIVILWAENNALAEGQRELPLRYSQFRRFRDATHTLSEAAAAINYGSISQPIMIGDRPRSLNCGLVTGNYFHVLGARPILGRLLRPDDDVVGAPPVLVLSYPTWKRQFGGQSAVVGRQVRNTSNGRSYMVVGVAPLGLGYPAGVDYWVPLVPAAGESRANVYIVGRLAPGTAQGVAGEELGRFIRAEAASGVDMLGSDAKAVAVHSLPDVIVASVRPAIEALTAGAALLLLIACASIGNLLIVRGAGRRGEVAIRRALGASYAHVVRQLLLESAVLAGLGGALGLLVAQAFLRTFLALAPPGLPQVDVLRDAGMPLLVAVGVTASAALLFGIGPALDSARVDLAIPLRGGPGGGTETRRRRRTKQALVVGQVAVALVNLAAAGVLVRSLSRLVALDMGFQTDRLSLLELTIPWQEYRDRTKLIRLHEDVVARIEALPGIVAATPVLLNPFNGVGGWDVNFAAEGQAPVTPDAAHPFTNVEVAGPDYFRTFGLPIRRGRGFEASDRQGSVQVVVVSEAVARQFWPGQDPLGERLQMLGGPGVGALPGWWTVVGVVGETRYRDLLHQVPTVYFPYQQYIAFGHLAIRTGRALPSVYSALRHAVQESGSGIDLLNARSMDQLLDEPLAQPRLSAVLLSLFGIVALLLAAIGLYGTLAFSVRQRTNEFGIRLALGAPASALRARVMKEALAIAGSGTMLGLVAAFVSLRVLKSLVYGISPIDPITLAAVCGILAAVAVIAAYLPARRATCIDPMLALRSD